MTNPAITSSQRDQAGLIWDYHQMGHEPEPVEVAIGLGSHDPGVADTAARLYHQGLMKTLVFSGGNSPTTKGRFPRGEAVHYREHALTLGVPDDAILVEPHATNTGANIALSRELLAREGIRPSSVLLITKPYMERRAYATTRRVWPEVDVRCASEDLAFADYLTAIGDQKLVVDMLVGDLQRIIEYPKLGYAIEQDVPKDVRTAYTGLVEAGFTSRLMA
ncbi:YdcF family protein [Streptomyces qinzhouensis]|uniref:YdcF family protein n=1 Tax=Streptomyces qinzhouensis TaxID=2599401 RepID=A0A5B8J8V0_9ACTN|nr:YdcF family protein [Streptomyces qinzhouensis]QDY78235.1 YdcF family protein [Streptomyces qinzhouensis]